MHFPFLYNGKKGIFLFKKNHKKFAKTCNLLNLMYQKVYILVTSKKKRIFQKVYKRKFFFS